MITCSLDPPSEFSELTVEQQNELVQWCKRNFRHAKTEWKERTSYGLKHDFDDGWPEGFYTTNGQFKGALLAAGFRAANTTGINWTWYIRPVNRRDYVQHLYTFPKRIRQV